MVALALSVVIMIALAYAIEFLVLRRLVNQEGIILFMATLGIAYFLEGFGQTIWGSDIYKIRLGLPQNPIFILESVFPGGLLIDPAELIAAIICAVMVLVLAVFFQVTRVGRALRAVADDHQAAQSVGIPLNKIWLMVWAVSGMVALVAGMMWGAKLGVQFSLSLVALKALPVLILGGFTSIPGAIVGGLIIGAGEKLAEVMLGPVLIRAFDLAGGGIENWFAYVLAPGVPAVPAAGTVRREASSSGYDAVFYREAGQFKTSYAADQAIFPIAQDRWFVIALVAFAFLGVPLFAGQYLYTEVLIPVLILSIAAIGLNILTGYCGQVSLGTGGFMAVGAYSAYNLALRLPETNIILVFLFAGLMAMLVGLLFGLPSLRIKGFYLAVATLAAQFFLEWAFARVKWFTNYAPSGSVAVEQVELFGIPIDTPGRIYIFVLAIVVRARARRQEPGARPDRAHVDGDARHGHRRRDHRDQAAARQAVGLRRVLLLHRRRRRAVGLPAARLVGAARLRHQPVVPGPVHDHHRGARDRSWARFWAPPSSC